MLLSMWWMLFVLLVTEFVLAATSVNKIKENQRYHCDTCSVKDFDNLSLVQCSLRAKGDRVANYKIGKCEVYEKTSSVYLVDDQEWKAITPRESPSFWKLSASNVCFQTKDDGFGAFILKKQGMVYALRMVYVGGEGVRCAKGIAFTHFGCDGKYFYNPNRLSVFVTEKTSRTPVFPPHNTPIEQGFYDYPGYHANSAAVTFYNYDQPIYVNGETELRIFYGDDLFGGNESNNAGTTCVDIYTNN